MADQMVEKYKQLVANGVDPERAKSLLKQAQWQQPAPTQTPVQQPVAQQPLWQQLKESAQQTFRAPVWALQWVSDVWQRTVGRLIWEWAKLFAQGTERLWHWIAEKISGREIPYRDMAWQMWDRPTYWDITKPILWEQADTGMTKFGRWVWQVAWTAALSAPLFGVWAAWSTALFGQAATKLWWLWIWAAWWILPWMATTQLWSLATRDKPASVWETLIWWWLWAIGGWIWWYRDVSKTQKLTKLLTEKWTSKNIEQAAEQGRIKFIKWIRKWRWEITPTERTANATQIIKKEIGKWKDPQDLVNKMDKLGKSKYETLSSELKQMKVWTMTKDKSNITNKIKELMWKSVKDERVASDIKKMDWLIKNVKQAKTADDLWKARTTRDKLFSEAQKKATSTSAPSTRNANKLWLEWRNIMNDSLDNIVKKQGGEWVKKSFYDMSSLLETKDNLVTKMPELIKDKPTKVWTALKYIWWASIAWWAWAALKSLAKWLWGN